MKRLSIITTVLAGSMLITTAAYAQRELHYSQYNFNTQAMNPAYAGSRNAFTITMLNRSQWSLAFDKAPLTQTLHLHTPTRNRNTGIGLSFQNDMVGPEKTTSIDGDFSYSIRLSEQLLMAFGIKAGISLYRVPLTDLIIDDPSDPLFSHDLQSHWLPNFGFGMYLRHDYYYIGLSIPRFLEKNYLTNAIYAGVRPALIERSYYLIGGAAFEINPDVDLVPTAVLRYRRGRPVEAAMLANLVFFETYSAGIIYRHNDSAGFTAGLGIGRQWKISYSFDWGIATRKAFYNGGSHELAIRYDIFLPENRWRRVPRYF